MYPVKRGIGARQALLCAGRGGLGLVHFKALERAQRAIAGSGIRRPAAGGQRLHTQQGNGQQQQIRGHLATLFTALRWQQSVYSCRGPMTA